ncbi:MAG: hypothetical protein GX963_08810 [Bacteroidales bacterium]|nr:hypothetical protein [Bacteroidales bacterium]
MSKSSEFITRNLDITTDMLPDDLLSLWVVQDKKDIEEQYNIFMFAYTLYLSQKNEGKEVELSVDELNSLFESFQVILSMEELRRKSLLNCNKVKLFDFDNYENLEFCIDRELLVF